MDVDSADMGTAIYKIDGNGKNLLKISESHLDYYSTPYNNPQLLQDGINIVYIKRVDLKDYEIRILNIETQEDKLLVNRARKLQKFLSQNFFVTEVFTNQPGKYVSTADTVRSVLELIDGKHDSIDESYFYMAGSIEDVVARSKAKTKVAK